ncbi:MULTISPECIES: ABC transporter ATP-binding protein [Mesorhizobium]|uniref:Nucleoside ABC transporter ATP-binding protein n=1 Tax=Mesorhizobium qingshengii TaxID=1165689 RepID=A0A1G5ZWM7_9HYPH|nr:MULTISPECIES: ABC transporter ATP-binding protein [Mesorhizobium]AID34979.1 ATP-binding cassette domain-containing protein [Mesorhizobium huakuii 7653R]MCH4560640.1 ABC transporter ATP-binding protein [Mesorhizobium jarvisii]SDA99095.1 nucleoside ABC transporter ATP-binding protein [Mesorhizobium qingshengii]
MTQSIHDSVTITGVHKKFGDFVAIHHASLTVRRGEVHAVIGENGAGKSTLMNILYGMFPPNAGQINVEGKDVSFNGPSEAIEAGIGMVHQHFKLVPSLSVAENIIIGSEPLTRQGLVDSKKAEVEAEALGRRFGLELDPRAIVSDLPVGLQQRVEILKALYRDARILILDEPTAVLTPQETRELFVTMRAFAESGRSIIFITHKLREVLAVADRISVMRQGRLLQTLDNQNVTAQQLASMMVGREVLLKVKKGKANAGETALEVLHLRANGQQGHAVLEDLSFSVRHGEIVALAGVQGNGQDEVVECIAGLRRAASGEIRIGGLKVGANPEANRNAGLAYIPADRGGLGLSLECAIWENMAVGHIDQFGSGPWFSPKAARDVCSRLISEFDIRGADPDKLAKALSGGNQQKVQLARELKRNAHLIIAEQPSQGVDIGSIESIHRTLVAMRDAGKAVFVVSADLDEVFSLSDRILVIYRGQIVADLNTYDTDLETVGRFMGGIESRTGQHMAEGHSHAH